MTNKMTHSMRTLFSNCPARHYRRRQQLSSCHLLAWKSFSLSTEEDSIFIAT
jgi:hypothetical protein